MSRSLSPIRRRARIAAAAGAVAATGGMLATGTLATVADLSAAAAADPSAAAAAAPGAATTPAIASQASTHRARAQSNALSIDEVGKLHLLSKHGFTLNESGPATGTFKGTIYVQLQIVSTSSVKAQVRMSLRSGSIVGEGHAAYHRGKTQASFDGTMSVLHGTGAYSKAGASGLSMDGTIQRKGDAIVVTVRGTVKA